MSKPTKAAASQCSPHDCTGMTAIEAFLFVSFLAVFGEAYLMLTRP